MHKQLFLSLFLGLLWFSAVESAPRQSINNSQYKSSQAPSDKMTVEEAKKLIENFDRKKFIFDIVKEKVVIENKLNIKEKKVLLKFLMDVYYLSKDGIDDKKIHSMVATAIPRTYCFQKLRLKMSPELYAYINYYLKEDYSNYITSVGVMKDRIEFYKKNNYKVPPEYCRELGYKN